MSDQRDDGGPAFPALHTIDGNWTREPLDKYAGMTLRDYFAAAALQGAIAATANAASDPAPERAANYAFRVADAMLAERAR